MFSKKAKFKLLIYFFSILFYSCSTENIDPINPDSNTNDTSNPTQPNSSGSAVYSPTAIGKVTNSPQTFGIRNDKKLSEYETIASNISPFNSEEFPDFRSVAFIQIEDGNGLLIGSGVLINSQWVLTAAHLFMLPEESKNLPSLSKISVLFGNDPNKPSKTLKVSQIILHPHWINSDGGFEKGTDLALLKLGSPVTDIAPAKINYDISGEKDKAYIWSCGFGDYSSQSGQNKNYLSKKHATVNVLDRIVDGLNTKVSGISYNGGVLAFDFDAPDGKFNTLGDNIINEQEKVLGSGNSAPEALEMEGGTVEGDSGGPIFIKIGGIWKVCGVLHGGIDDVAPKLKDSSYGDISVYCRTASASSWIQSVIN